MKKRISLFIYLLVPVLLFAQQNPLPDELLKPLQVFPEKITWVDVKPPLPQGAGMSVLEGDPKKPGIFTMRIKFPSHYMILPHTHPQDERVTILSGSMFIGIGETPDEKNATLYSTGCFYVNPAGIHHYAFTGDEGATVQITGLGPWELHYLDEKK